MEKGKEVMIKLKRTREIEIELEEAQNLVAQVLQEDFDFISKEIRELQYLPRTMTSVEVQDWNNSMEVREAMKVLMRYYMTRNDYNEFMELQRVYGNV
jgi:hypothetical protein